jgi:hypothetical protein
MGMTKYNLILFYHCKSSVLFLEKDI